MRGVDVSIYSGEISVDQWKAIKADGYALAIVGLFHGRSVNHYAARQMRAAHEAGMLLAGYVLIAPWTGMSGAGQLETGLCAADPYLLANLRFVAVDCEIDGITTAMISDALVGVQARELYPIIYTGWWWWYGHFNDSHAFSHIPLWAADYDGEANLDTRMYGGWTKAIGKQYAGTTMLHGVNCDLNFFDDEFVKGEEVPEFTEAQENRIKEIFSWEPPGLEAWARGEVVCCLYYALAAVTNGEWVDLPPLLEGVKAMARRCERWEGE